MAAATTVQSYVARQNRVLIASADPLFRKRVMNNFAYAKDCCEEATGGAHALFKLQQMLCDKVLLDRHLPDPDSTELSELIQRRYPGTTVAFIDAQSSIAVVDATEDGQAQSHTTLHGDQRGRATGHAMGPNDSRPFEKIVATVGKLSISPHSQHSPQEPLHGMIGCGPAMQKVYRLARMVAKRDTPVLLTGETGTGKELVAAAIHELSPRSKHPFVVVNCAAIPEALFEAELFGHARGAFTGAVQARLGRIHMAQGGTLFLDEIGELPLSMQAKLLRFLQNREVQRLGSSEVYRVDVRVICATNVRLPELVQNKQFREDLFYRMSVFPIVVPPLRERLEDVADLAAHFLEVFCAEAGPSAKHLNSTVLDLLTHSDWAGNVRELQHVLERAFILSGNEAQITPECLSTTLD